MLCESFEQRLHDLLDRRVRPEDDVHLRGHAENCTACAKVLAAQTSLWEGLTRRETPEPSAGFVNAILARIAEQGTMVAQSNEVAMLPYAVATQTTRRMTPMRLAMLATAAAVLAISAPVAFRMLKDTGQTNGSAPVIAEQSSDAKEIQIAETPRRVENGAPPMENSTAQMNPVGPESTPSAPPEEARHTGNVVGSAAADGNYLVLLEPWRELGDRLGFTEAGAAPTVQSAAAVAIVTDRLRSSLSVSIESTLNVLRTALPDSNEQNPSKPQASLVIGRETQIS